MSQDEAWALERLLGELDARVNRLSEALEVPVWEDGWSTVQERLDALEGRSERL